MKTIKTLNYCSVGRFYDGVAPVTVEKHLGTYKTKIDFFGEAQEVEEVEEKWGFIDTNGNEIIPCTYEAVGSFSEGLTNFKSGNSWGYMDKNGSTIIEPRNFLDFGSFSDGLALVQYEEGEYCYIDKTGNDVISGLKGEIDDLMDKNFSHGLALKRDDESEDLNFGYIDKTGKFAIEPKFEYCDSFSEGLAAVMKNDLWGFIDTDGNEVIPCQYFQVRQFSEGLACVLSKDDFKWGFIDVNGKTVIPFDIKDVISDFKEGLAILYYPDDSDDGGGSYKYCIDKTGKRVGDSYSIMEILSGGYILADDHQESYLIDSSGKVIETIPEDSNPIYVREGIIVVDEYINKVLKSYK